MIYRFEDQDDALDLLPLAARRALDRAGCKVSLKAWRGAPLEARRALVARGAAKVVDAAQTRASLHAAGIAFAPIPPQEEPAPAEVPVDLAGALGHAVGDATWRALSPLDRYVLVKLARKPEAAERLARAITEILVVHEPRLTHLSVRGEAHMVDVAAKPETLRRAVANAVVRMRPETAARLRSGSVSKGDVLSAARIAGIQAAKRTPELIPLCHAVRLTRVTVELRIEDDRVDIEAAAEAVDRTGVEMEALVAASAAALTVYDMLKGIDRGMTFEVGLQEKAGGASGRWERR